MAKNGHDKVQEKLIRIGFYELEKTIGLCVPHTFQIKAYIANDDENVLITNCDSVLFSFLILFLQPIVMLILGIMWYKYCDKSLAGKGNFAVVKLASNLITKTKVRIKYSLRYFNCLYWLQNNN